MQPWLNKLKEDFEKNVNSVNELIEFDHIILDFAINNVTILEKKLKEHGLAGPMIEIAENTAKAIQNVRNNNSLRLKYKQFFNQCLVLLVSYFESSLEDVFTISVGRSVKLGIIPEVKSESVKLSIGELHKAINGTEQYLGELILSKRQYSFQDLQSTKRVFKECFGIEHSRDKVEDNIIIGQACRHAIVHCAGIVDQQLKTQIRDVKLSELQINIQEGSPIELLPNDVIVIGKSMNVFIGYLLEKIDTKLTS
jgi:hypothetical protein